MRSRTPGTRRTACSSWASASGTSSGPSTSRWQPKPPLTRPRPTPPVWNSRAAAFALEPDPSLQEMLLDAASARRDPGDLAFLLDAPVEGRGRGVPEVDPLADAPRKVAVHEDRDGRRFAAREEPAGHPVL